MLLSVPVFFITSEDLGISIYAMIFIIIMTVLIIVLVNTLKYFEK